MTQIAPALNESTSAGDEREVLVRAQGVSKRFCRSLKKSLWYGVQDIASELVGRKYDHELRPDEFWSVNDVSFELRRGECLGLIGRNGAGKTTLLRMLNGLIKPDKGRIEINGRVGALIALGAGFNPILTGRENIYVNASVLGLSKKEIDEKVEGIIDFAEIGDFIDSPVQTYSSGMQVRLGFAVATALNPDILILDEVLTVGDAAFRVKCFNRMHEVLKDAAVIFVSHNMPQVMRISDRVLLLSKGNAEALSSNLGEVILQYYEQGESIATKIEKNTKEAKITSVWIENTRSNEINRLKYNDPFSIHLSFWVKENYPPSFIKILMVVIDGEQNPVAQVLEVLDLEINKGDNCISLIFSESRFSAGTFSISVALLGGDKGFLLTNIQNITSFYSENSLYSYASISLSPDSFAINE